MAFSFFFCTFSILFFSPALSAPGNGLTDRLTGTKVSSSTATKFEGKRPIMRRSLRSLPIHQEPSPALRHSIRSPSMNPRSLSVSPPHEYTARHQQGNRVGSCDITSIACGASVSSSTVIAPRACVVGSPAEDEGAAVDKHNPHQIKEIKVIISIFRSSLSRKINGVVIDDKQICVRQALRGLDHRPTSVMMAEIGLDPHGKWRNLKLEALSKELLSFRYISQRLLCRRSF